MVIKIEENSFFGVKKENNKWYVIPIKENATKHDYKIAEIEAKKLGLNLTEDLEIVFEVQLTEKKEYCANYERDNQEVCQDSIVESVRQKLLDRSNVGIKKYNTTLFSNNKDNYFNHLQQELMDATLYIQKIMQQEKDIIELVAKYPNNMELGSEIRKIYGK